MKTLEEYINKFGQPKTSTKVAREYSCHLIDPPQSGTSFDIVGNYTFITGKSRRKETQYFLLTDKGGNFSSGVKLNEPLVALRIMVHQEALRGAGAIIVNDIMLPKALGFSGKKHLHSLLKEQLGK